MSFYPLERRLPSGLKTAEFLLEPLTPNHVERDYEAVMASREMLNLWSGTSWPTPDFTLAENLADLEWHDREHRERIAFTYTVLDPSGSQCLGCLYIKPLSELETDSPLQSTSITSAAATARFWVRSSTLDDSLDRRLLQALIPWFIEQWDLPEFYFHARLANRQQVKLFKTSTLEYRFDLNLPQRGGIHRFWVLSGP